MSADQAPSASHLCDVVIARHSLLQHPFYVAWSEGTLPVAALGDYAREYGAFIDTIADGWEMAGAPEIARIEREHADIWDSTFATGLGTSVTSPRIGEVADLVEISRELFANRVTALGGLYAFEAQQPATAQSKLKGLREHYPQLPQSCGEYFDLHWDDYDEPSLLAGEINALRDVDRERAVAACERMCRGLNDALTGIHAPHVAADGQRSNPIGPAANAAYREARAS
jgi:pyrroloquinoline-quinone synthase